MKKNPGPGEGSIVKGIRYSDEDFSSLPVLAIELARGCGNPVGFADLRPGDVVVDLGCGGGIDVILAAKSVGSQGKVIGVDIAPNMIDRAKQAVEAAGLSDDNVDLRVGDVEKLTLPDGIANVVLSNCVMSLVPNKDAAYREAFRILKPGGRLVIADLVLVESIDPAVRRRLEEAWQGALGGSIKETDYMNHVKSAGFGKIHLVSRDILTPGEVRATSCCPGEKFAKPAAPEDLEHLKDKVASIKFTAVKPL
ncbi:MAG: methyltransferase domain-containing protein [Planctomycetota bacterium]